MQDNIVPFVRNLFLEEEFYFQQDGTAPHYHNDMRNILGVYFPGRWIGHRKGQSINPDPPDLTLLDFYLWVTLKNTVC
jgi:hypothetical protein